MVVDAIDADVYVLSAFVAHQITGTLAIKSSNKLINHEAMCKKTMAGIIIPFHVHTGCDTTAGFYGHD